MKAQLLRMQLDANKAFIAFVVMSLFLSVLISVMLVGREASTVLNGYKQQASVTEAKLSAKYIENFLETRILLLKDLSSQPIITNGVMGSGLSEASLNDYLSEFKILGEKENLWVFNVLGDYVYKNNDDLAIYDTPSDWLEDLLNGELEYAVLLDQSQGQSYFKLAVPISYNGFTEGALIVKFQTPIDVLLSEVIESKTHGIKLSGPWLSYSNLNYMSKYGSVYETKLQHTGLKLNYLVDSSLVERQVNQVIISIASAIFVSLCLSSLFLFLVGQKLLLNPYRKLELSQQATKLSEERLNLAINGSLDGIWDWDIKTGKVFCSERFRELIGYKPTDEFPEDYTVLERMVHEDDREYVKTSLKAHLQQKSIYDVQHRFKTKNGEFRVYRVKGDALFDENQRAIRMAGSMTDVTEQIESEEALKKAKEENDLLALSIDASNLGVTISSVSEPELPLIYINQAFTNITGYGEEILGQSWSFLQGEQTSQESVDKIRQALKNHDIVKVDLLNYKKNGQPFWNSLQLFPVHNEAGELTAYVGIQQDITDRVASEKALKEAKMMAEQASIAKSEFLASMSHEIRTPMNGVLGMLNLLLNSDLNAEQQHRINVAMSSANSLLTLINDILDFSKVDAGKLELEHLEFDLRGLLGDFAESAVIQAHSKRIELILDVTNIDEAVVIGDPGRLRQILSNLVGNAIKFTSDGEVLIEATLIEFDTDNWQLNCNIKDTGIGISPEQQTKLFQSFSQVDASTTRKYGGTGLGLAIVKKLCELMDGAVSVSSQAGKGSCFSFSILLGKSNASFHVIPDVEMQELNILLVDDNKTNREVLRAQLEHWGASVTEARSGIEALTISEAYFAKHNKCFDIAFLDMQMPVMDGAQLGEHIKANEHLKAMKLIMMTSMCHKGDAKFFANLGFDGYFPKPATTFDLFAALSIVAEDGEALKGAKPLVTTHYIKSLKAQSALKLEEISWGEGIRILLAEDNRVNQIVAQSMLAKLNLTHIDIAANGEEVIQNLLNTTRETKYTVILMDCQMPEMDGYKASQAVRNGKAGELYKDIPIIAMTANAMVGDKDKCLEAGMDDYISKPIKPEVLFERLLQWLPYKKIES
ncbi:response regulator [Pseudoalteromonas phenolica]|uniref:response regulator n=1 Tax=Pseudoalteromonas phenolica TaxID=161398 RepID=UPI00384C198B